MLHQPGGVLHMVVQKSFPFTEVLWVALYKHTSLSSSYSAVDKPFTAATGDGWTHLMMQHLLLKEEQMSKLSIPWANTSRHLFCLLNDVWAISSTINLTPNELLVLSQGFSCSLKRQLTEESPNKMIRGLRCYTKNTLITSPSFTCGTDIDPDLKS